MTDIGEVIAVEAAVRGGAKCWYCEKDPGRENRTNALDEDPSSVGGGVDEAPENYVRNCASKLGSNLGKHPKWKIPIPHDTGKKCGVVPAAHHLIPGNASLKKATGLHKYMSAEKGLIENDIGYDVNAKPNGVWLPGSYGVRPGLTFKQTWSAYSRQREYALSAMKEAEAQFHDTHPQYSSNVKRTLVSLAAKLAKPPKSKCPVCGKEADRERPPYGLVGRLNFISGKHRSMLLQPKTKKKYINAGYFTSSKVSWLFP